MAIRKGLVVLLACPSFALLAYGCSSSTTPSMMTDSGAPDAATEASKDAADTCNPDKPLFLVPWAPPTAIHQGLCSVAQTSAYDNDLKMNTLEDFRSRSANATCLTCIETQVSAAEHGPVIVTGSGTTIDVRLVNFGGCTEHVTSDTTCGKSLDAYNNCAIQECGDCDDYLLGGRHVTACLTKAIAAGGKCHDSPPVPKCETELQGVASMCDTLGSFLFWWCGSDGEAGVDGATDAMTEGGEASIPDGAPGDAPDSG